MTPFKSSAGRNLGKLVEGYKTSSLGLGLAAPGSGGSGGFGITSISDLTSQASWTVWPNGGNYSASYNDSNYYGARGEVAHGNGTIRHNNYEYGIYTKFHCRDDHTKTGVFQIYGL